MVLKQYLTNEQQIVDGATYQITEEFKHLRKVWENFQLGYLEDAQLRKYCGKMVTADVRAKTSVQPGVVKCKSATKEVLHVPVTVLSRVDTVTGSHLTPTGDETNKNNAGAVSIRYYTSVNDVKTGRTYKMTGNLDRLKEEWSKCRLEVTTAARIRNLLRKYVKVENLDREYNAVLVKIMDAENNFMQVPVTCLINEGEAGSARSTRKPASTSKSKPPPPSEAGAAPGNSKSYLKYPQIVRGRRYKVTDDLGLLEKWWQAKDLDRFVELKYFLLVEGSCRDLDNEDELVKLVWKNGTEEEWFPAEVLMQGSKQAATATSSKSTASTVAHQAAEQAQARNTDMLERYFTEAGGEYYLQDVKFAIRGREYTITGDLNRLTSMWKKCGLGEVEPEFLQTFLNRNVRVTQIQQDDQTCEIRFSDNYSERWIPASVLRPVLNATTTSAIAHTETRERPDTRRRPENNSDVTPTVILRPGDNVRLVKVARADYENCRGRLVQYLPDREKWRVHLLPFDKIVVVQPRNIKKEADEQEKFVSDISKIKIGSQYRVTKNYQHLASALEQMGEEVNDTANTEGVMEMLDEVVQVRRKFDSSQVECLFNNSESKFLPYYVLTEIDRAVGFEDQEDLRDIAGLM